MRRGNSKGAWTLLLFILAGVIIGSVIGDILAQYIDHPIFQQTVLFGTQGEPAWINLLIIKFAFGLVFNINFGTILGIILGIVFFLRA